MPWIHPTSLMGFAAYIFWKISGKLDWFIQSSSWWRKVNAFLQGAKGDEWPQAPGDAMDPSASLMGFAAYIFLENLRQTRLVYPVKF